MIKRAAADLCVGRTMETSAVKAAALLLLLGQVCSGGEEDSSMLRARLAVVIEKSLVPGDISAVKALFATQKTIENADLQVDFLRWPIRRLPSDVTAVISVVSCESTWSLHKMMDVDSALHLAITPSPCERLPAAEGLSIPLTVAGGELSQLLLDMRTMDVFQWDSLAMVVEENGGSDDFAKIVQGKSRTESPAVSSFSISPNSSSLHEDVAKVLNAISERKLSDNVISKLPKAVLTLLLRKAGELGMLNPRSQWLLFVPDASDAIAFTELLVDGSNVAFVCNATVSDGLCEVRQPFRCNPSQMLYCRQLRMYPLNDVNLLARVCDSLSNGVLCHLKGLVVSFYTSLERIVQRDLNTSSQVSDDEWETLQPTPRERRDGTLAQIVEMLGTGGFCGTCSLWKVYSAATWGAGDSPALLRAGSWSPRLGLQTGGPLFPHVTGGFCGRNLPVLSFHNPPWQIISYNETEKKFEYGGLFFKVLDALAEKLNFSYSVLQPDSNRGTLVDSGESSPEDVVAATTSTADEMNELETFSKINIPWEQLIEYVSKKQVFMGAAAFAVSEGRKQKVNFTEPLGAIAYTFLSARPREISRAGLFVRPFSSDTWLCVAVSVAAMGPLLHWFHRHSHLHRDVVGLRKLRNCCWYMYGALLQQGGVHIPRADSGRLIVGTWWLVVLVLVTSYSGNLVAFLTFPMLEPPLNSVRDLSSRALTCGLLAGSSLELLLQKSDDPALRQLHSSAEVHGQLDRALVDRLSSGGHVLLHNRVVLRQLTWADLRKTSSCRFAIGDESFLQEEVAMILPKDSPYLPLINDHIRRMRQAGLVAKWESDAKLPKDRCSASAASTADVTNHTVNLDDMQGCFFVLFLGTVISFLVIVVECGLHLYKRSGERKLVRPFVV